MELPAEKHRSQAGVCVSPVLWPWGSEGVFGQRGGGSGEQLEGTQAVPQVRGWLIGAGKEKRGRARLPREVEGLGQDGGWVGARE